MDKLKLNEMEHLKRWKFIKLYLTIFLIYTSIDLLITFSIIIQEQFYGQQDLDFDLRVLFMAGIFWVFNFYNIIILIKLIKKKMSKWFILLSFSGLFYLFIIILNVISLIVFSNYIFGTDFITNYPFTLTLKFLQLIFIICLFVKISKKDNRRDVK